MFKEEKLENISIRQIVSEKYNKCFGLFLYNLFLRFKHINQLLVLYTDSLSFLFSVYLQLEQMHLLFFDFFLFSSFFSSSSYFLFKLFLTGK